MYNGYSVSSWTGKLSHGSPKRSLMTSRYRPINPTKAALIVEHTLHLKGETYFSGR
jgi:hypothetical protein